MYKVFCFLILFGFPVFASGLIITVDGKAQGEIKIDLLKTLHHCTFLKF